MCRCSRGTTSEFVPNVSVRQGTDHVAGLRNPTLAARVRAYAPTAVLLLTYNYWAIYEFLLRWRRTDPPLLFRGDSHRLVQQAGMKAGTTASLHRSGSSPDGCLPVRRTGKPALLRRTRRPRVAPVLHSARGRQRALHVRRAHCAPRCAGLARRARDPGTSSRRALRGEVRDKKTPARPAGRIPAREHPR